jgi:hypothetical protein
MWAAIAVSVLVAAFGVSLVAGFWAATLMASFVVALLLAPAFVAMMVAIAVHASPERRVWGQLGATFAAIYAVMVTITYYLQLTVVRTGDGRFSAEALRLLEFSPGSALFALDMLGYGFMTLATLAAAPVFVGPGLARWLRIWFFAHGLLVVPTPSCPSDDGRRGSCLIRRHRQPGPHRLERVLPAAGRHGGDLLRTPASGASDEVGRVRPRGHD